MMPVSRYYLSCIIFRFFTRQEPSVADFSPEFPRNNIVLASAAPLDPTQNRQGWQWLQQFADQKALYGSLPRNRFTSLSAVGISGRYFATKKVPLNLDAMPDANMQRSFRNALAGGQVKTSNTDNAINVMRLTDPSSIAALQNYYASSLPKDQVMGWNGGQLSAVNVERVDWVGFGRHMLESSVFLARQPAGGSWQHSADILVGPSDADPAARRAATWKIQDIPLFTDSRPNADIYNW